jgi:diguanylate cyclase (GGDEF)-like protein/PAS domain S-box-containing protein
VNPITATAHDRRRRPGVAAAPGSEEFAGSAEQVFAQVSDLMAVIERSGRIVSANPAWEQMLGWPLDEVLGTQFVDLVQEDDVAITRELVVDRNEVSDFCNRVKHRDGSERSVLWSAKRTGDHWFAVGKDVTVRLSRERRALHDELTGLANRALLLEHLGAAVTRLGREDGALLATFFIDLDGFKLVNDGLGHEAGDQLLRAVGGRLRDVVRESDLIGRFGGDEFVIIAERLAVDAEAVMVAERIIEALERDFDLVGGRSGISCSIGIATTRDALADPETLLREADIAMYRAKGKGPGHVSVFDSHVRDEVAARVRIERQLRQAVKGDEVGLVYQPIVSVGDATLVGVEALARWRHPEEGWLKPSRFIPLAEATGLIVPIGARVIELATKQAAAWRRAGHDFTVSVNVSRRQLLEPEFATLVREAVSEAGVPGQMLCLEITETAAPTRLPQIVDALHEIRGMGIRIALDDFGVGYSTLSNLRELPIDLLKVDRSFVAGLAVEHSADRALVASVMALARELNLPVIADGVDDPRQLASLRAMACPFAQGDLFAPPGPADKIFAGYSKRLWPGMGDASTIREFMRQIGIPARIVR